MRLINGDCLKELENIHEHISCVFMDPPDAIGLKYNEYDDNTPRDEYVGLLHKWVSTFVEKADTVWISFNSRWLLEMASVVSSVLTEDIEFKPCVQTFTFGQYRKNDLGNCHRPLWRIKKKSAPLYPENIQVPSWRQLNGDKRAAGDGKTPGDVFDFPRVTGNSKQRRKWHVTQLNEELVERCIKFSTKEGDLVLDPFLGSGTTLRVCSSVNRNCIGIEMDAHYCKHIAKENNLTRINLGEWVCRNQNIR